MKGEYIKVCPKCGSDSVTFNISDAGSYDFCRDCQFVMPSFPEMTKEKAKI